MICLAVGCLLAYGLRPPSLDPCRKNSRQTFASGRYAEALNHAQRALQRRPADPESLCLAGEVLVKLRRPAEAVAYLERLPNDDESYLGAACVAASNANVAADAEYTVVEGGGKLHPRPAN